MELRVVAVELLPGAGPSGAWAPNRCPPGRPHQLHLPASIVQVMGSASQAESRRGARELSAVIVRTAAGGELDQAGEVCAAAYRAGGVSSSDYERLLRDAARRARSAEVLVAVGDGDRVLGTVTYVASVGPYAQIRYDHEAELRMLAVAPERQRAGIGAKLVQASLQKAIADGLSGVAISTTAQMHAAHRLYQRLGFRRNAARDWSPRPGLLLRVYELELGERVRQVTNSASP